MTFPLAGLGAGPAVHRPRDRTELGRDQFLALLVTQLKHQDPLSPLQADAFAAQLAQFAAVEQLTQLNDSFADQTVESARGTMLEKTVLGASLIGKRVLAAGDQLTVSSGGTATAHVDVAGLGGAATLLLLDQTGRLISTHPAGAVGSGAQRLDLGGLPPGTYRYAVEVRDAAGQTQRVTTFTEGVVDGVLFEQGTIVLRIGAMRVPLDQLSEITP
jgi:flagellar basal-body rod modification protein FlgD